MDRRRSSRLRAAAAAFASNADEPVAPPRPAAPGAVHLMAEAADGIRTIVRNATWRYSTASLSPRHSRVVR